MQFIMKGTAISAAALLLIIPASLWGSSQASENSMALQDCCLSTSANEIPWKIVRSYQIQLPSDGCKVHAVVFLTKRNKHLCSPPGEMWVKKLLKKLDDKKGRKAKLGQKRNQKRLKSKRNSQA
ncbi:C-C motif chemokine 19-like [Stegostoma tigrinum]|uniref:C-C motif chemokine 19-like n=1 Tax=Stegostoma tigrinum TaxID=3053191 RepID=UPI0028709D7A|nr:C-C motif chemokine 19-like [Stegostoma tigrinum]